MHDVAAVGLDGTRADAQASSNSFITESLGDSSKHLTFPLTQRADLGQGTTAVGKLLERLLRGIGTETGFSLGDFANGGDYLGRRSVFKQETASTRL